jgi:hypothetical protein
MARTLSDTLIIAVIEAATRLTGARGPIGGSAAAAAQGGAAATPPAGEAGSGGATGATSTAAAPTSGGSGAGEGGAPVGGAEHDPRSADQIAADFRTIYTQIEELVKSSAEQETKAVGFGPVSR